MNKQRNIFDNDKHTNHTDKDAIDWVERNFPEENYGYNILIYEAWPFRNLLEQAYMAGKESLQSERDRLKAAINDALDIGIECDDEIDAKKLIKVRVILEKALGPS